MGGAIGDRYVIGEHGECCVPPQAQVTVHSYTKNQSFLFLACDGLFYVASTNDTIAWVKQLLEDGETVDQIAKRVVYSALKSKTNDNVTVMIALI